MKGRESGMPEESYWRTFFDAECAIGRFFGPEGCQGDAVEFGSGYGTFTLPAARRATGAMLALDIEPDLIAALRAQAQAQGLGNLRAEVRDFVAEGTGLRAASQAHAMIYNLLHIEDPVALLREAHRVLRPGGALSVMHWRSDIPTPRGPSLDIRPSPQQCEAWMREAGFADVQAVDLSDCCPYHFGLLGTR
jgi:SAM-dependent methyltransferase